MANSNHAKRQPNHLKLVACAYGPSSRGGGCARARGGGVVPRVVAPLFPRMQLHCRRSRWLFSPPHALIVVLFSKSIFQGMPPLFPRVGVRQFLLCMYYVDYSVGFFSMSRFFSHRQQLAGRSVVKCDDQ